MKSLQISAILITLLITLSGCGKQESSGEPAASTAAEVPAAGKAIEFVDTQEGKPFQIDAALFNTPAAKEFLATGKNPYVGNEEAIAKGKKIFQLYSCTQCHGAQAQGQVGPGLVGPNFRYAKNTTNKGMFETIWHGTNGGMGAKGIGLMDPTDPKNGISPDEMLKIIAWIRSMSNGLTGNE